MTYPVTPNDNLPDLAANSYSVLFGDFQRGYLIVDRLDPMRVFTDVYTARPYVLWYCLRRTTGGVLDSNAIKVLKTAAS